MVNSIRWESHVCLPLHEGASLAPLIELKEAGVDYVSVNVGMDLNPIEQVMSTIAGFRASIEAHPDLRIAGTLEEIRACASMGLMSVGFDLEGSLPLLEQPSMIGLYRAMGVRQMHLAYNRNNSIAGGCHDQPQGLSPLGIRCVEVMNDVGMIVDCSHASEKTALDLIDCSRTPVVYSHANAARLASHPRNVSDAVIEAVADRGGVICLNGVSLFLNPDLSPLDALIEQVCYLVGLVGAGHVGIGLDIGFSEEGIDDTPPPPFDPSYWWPPEAGYTGGLAQITYLPVDTWSLLPERLIQAGISSEERAMILGENMARILEEVEGVSHAR